MIRRIRVRKRFWRCWVGQNLLFPLVGETLGAAEVAGESVDSRFDEDESVLGVFVLAALFQVAADVHCLLDQAVDVFGNFGGGS